MCAAAAAAAAGCLATGGESIGFRTHSRSIQSQQVHETRVYAHWIHKIVNTRFAYHHISDGNIAIFGAGALAFVYFRTIAYTQSHRITLEPAILRSSLSLWCCPFGSHRMISILLAKTGNRRRMEWGNSIFIYLIIWVRHFDVVLLLRNCFSFLVVLFSELISTSILLN